VVKSIQESLPLSLMGNIFLQKLSLFWHDTNESGNEIAYAQFHPARSGCMTFQVLQTGSTPVGMTVRILIPHPLCGSFYTFPSILQGD
jgi:hypothetical protein